MLSFAEAYEEAETLEEINYDRKTPGRRQLGMWVLEKKPTWAVVLVAVRERIPSKSRFGGLAWYISRWRWKTQRWNRGREIRFNDKTFRDLFCFGGPLKWARVEALELLEADKHLEAMGEVGTP